MQPDTQALAEAKALLTCVQVTQDPAEQNRLWNQYYRLSDRVFPEVAALHSRYKSLKGAERQRFKNEYMELVRRLWAATDPDSAHGVPFTEPARRQAAPVPPLRGEGKYRHRAQHSARRIFRPWVLVAVLLVLLCVGGVFWRISQYDNAPVAIFLSPPKESGAPENAVLAPSLPEEVATASERDTEMPTEEREFSEAEIEAELARTILPQFKPIPAPLRGKGDRLVVGERVYQDVYVSESKSQYLLRIPEKGSVESVSKADASVTLAEKDTDRKALLALWKENRAEIDRTIERREKEKQLRRAAHHRAQKKAREIRLAAQEKERWRVKGAEWLALTVAQRQASRMRAYGNWQGIQEDVDTVQELHANISWAYRLIGISDDRIRRFGAAYKEWAQVAGPNFDVEDKLLAYGWGREDILREMTGWEREYYRLLDHVNDVYPVCEARVEEIQRLDEALSPKQRRLEAAVDWNSALEGDKTPEVGGGGSVGTGFIVADGYVMTCAHVVRHGSNIKATSTKGTVHQATIVTMDTANDWALLKVAGLSGPPIPIAEAKPNVGATIYCLGYPLGGIKNSADPIVGSGNIAALQRLDGDQRFMQITAPVNPGNSGGPVLDQYGRWVGMVSQKMNDKRSLEASETVNQGINFAIKAAFIQPMLDPRKGVTLSHAVADASGPMSLETIAARVAPSIVKIEVR